MESERDRDRGKNEEGDKTGETDWIMILWTNNWHIVTKGENVPR